MSLPEWTRFYPVLRGIKKRRRLTRHLPDRSCYMENRLRLLPAIKSHLAVHQEQREQGQDQKRNHTEYVQEPIVSIRCNLKLIGPCCQADTILIPGLIIDLPVLPDRFHPSSVDRLIQITFQTSEFKRSFPRHGHQLRKSFAPAIEQAEYFFEVERLRLLPHHSNQLGFQESFIPFDQSVTPRKETT